MRLVIIESPYAGQIARNVTYARACIADCLSREEAPIASHLLYTQEGILDDNQPGERQLGIEAGFAWLAVAHAVIVYDDYGISPGMAIAIVQAARYGIPVEFRNLYRRKA